MTGFTDVQLLDLARGGDQTAFAELYGRHRAVARRVAMACCRRGDPDDLVSEAFEKVFAALRRNRGPTEGFRPYLFVTLRRLAARHARRVSDEPLDELPEPVAAARGEALDLAERQLITAAFEALPDRWQAVLWHTTIEGREPREVGRAVGMSSNAVSALAYRARERLRQEYLQAHLQAAPRPACEPHRSLLGAYVRNGLSRRDRTTTRRHLESCTSCHALVAELNDINGLLVRSLLPVFFASDIGDIIAGGVSGATTEADAAAEAAEAAEPTQALDTADAVEAGQAAASDVAGGDRSTWLWVRPGGLAPTIGSIAAAMTLLIALGAGGALVLRDDPESTTAATSYPERDDPAPDTTESTTAANPPSLPAATDSTPCEPGVSAADDRAATDSSEPSASDSLLGGLLGGLSATSTTTTMTPASPADGSGLRIERIACEQDTMGQDNLVVEVAGTQGAESGDDPQPAPGVSVSTPDLVPDVLPGVLPDVDASLAIELDDGARVALSTNLPEMCDVNPDRRDLVCTLDDTLGNAVTGTLSETGVGLELEGSGGSVARVELRDGDLVVDAKLVNLLP